MDPATELPFLQWLQQTAESVSIDAAGKLAEQPSTRQSDALIEALQSRIADLEAMLQGFINSQLAESLFQPFGRVRVVKKSATSSKQGQERILENGVFTNFVGGLNVTSDSDPAALVTLDSDHVCILQCFDSNGRHVRNVIISGTTAADQGQYQFQLKSMVSQQSPGWDPARASPPFPP